MLLKLFLSKGIISILSYLALFEAAERKCRLGTRCICLCEAERAEIIKKKTRENLKT
jgi:hypothetical protein